MVVVGTWVAGAWVVLELLEVHGRVVRVAVVMVVVDMLAVTVEVFGGGGKGWGGDSVSWHECIISLPCGRRGERVAPHLPGN